MKSAKKKHPKTFQSIIEIPTFFQQPTWRLWGEEREKDVIFTVYLKKVRYHRPTPSASSVSFYSISFFSLLAICAVAVDFVVALYIFYFVNVFFPQFYLFIYFWSIFGCDSFCLKPKTKNPKNKLWALTTQYISVDSQDSDDEISHLEWETVRVRFVKAATLSRLVEALSTDDGELESTLYVSFLL